MNHRPSKILIQLQFEQEITLFFKLECFKFIASKTLAIMYRFC